ncbi:tetratricopeptide repeat protein [Streptomyces sp. NBC_01754]|uniref:tetratricopeptide repeat protein n=1 Tax=Streptomyces sp. NBC_01754 TaxID=2975930 RepID=UPI002DDB1F75|nr:tetratricopeptide repeat protein [Streptomyces sp. NBC_01754]WSC92379.1 tetratricopeptide repeat protein [Streptomyces sp. NBC_01754]
MTTRHHPLTEQADALRSLGRVDRAKELLARRLAEDPEDSAAWCGLAHCHWDAREITEVLTTTGEALRIAPEYMDALLLRAYALRRVGRCDEALAAAEEAVRLRPDAWQSHAVLSDALTAWEPRRPESLEAARQAVRLSPEEVGPYQALWGIAALSDLPEPRDRAVAEVLRIDPGNSWALARQAAARELRPDTALRDVTDGYATALAANPEDTGLRMGLYRSVFRMLRGTRWLAVLSLVMAALAVDIFPDEGGAKEMPLPLTTRLWALTLMAAAWGFGAWRRYRRLRTGVRMGMWELVRELFWARLVLAQATWGTLCALSILLVPWTARGIPQVLFWTGLTPIALTIWFDRPRTR